MSERKAQINVEFLNQCLGLQDEFKLVAESGASTIEIPPAVLLVVMRVMSNRDEKVLYKVKTKRTAEPTWDFDMTFHSLEAAKACREMYSNMPSTDAHITKEKYLPMGDVLLESDDV